MGPRPLQVHAHALASYGFAVRILAEQFVGFGIVFDTFKNSEMLPRAQGKRSHDSVKPLASPERCARDAGCHARVQHGQTNIRHNVRDESYSGSEGEMSAAHVSPDVTFRAHVRCRGATAISGFTIRCASRAESLCSNANNW